MTLGKPRFLGLSERFLLQKSFLGQFLRKVRRTYFSIFEKEYVRQSIAVSRVGECNRCGACCKLVYRCPFLGHDGEKQAYCRIYGGFRPEACKIYPFDRVDAEIEECTYKFR